VSWICWRPAIPVERLKFGGKRDFGDMAGREQSDHNARHKVTDDRRTLQSAGERAEQERQHHARCNG